VGITLGRESAFEIGGESRRPPEQDCVIILLIEAAVSLEKWLQLFGNCRLPADR